jgi:hypothetical protein
MWTNWGHFSLQIGLPATEPSMLIPVITLSETLLSKIHQSVFVPSGLNVADIFTKNLDSARFTELQKKVMVHPRHIRETVLKSEVQI